MTARHRPAAEPSEQATFVWWQASRPVSVVSHSWGQQAVAFPEKQLLSGGWGLEFFFSSFLLKAERGSTPRVSRVVVKIFFLRQNESAARAVVEGKRLSLETGVGSVREQQTSPSHSELLFHLREHEIIGLNAP